MLQCWIYEYFPSIGFAIAVEDYDERRPCACRWTSGKVLPVWTYRRHLDMLTPDVVCWITYGDHRSFRKFDVISLFPDHLRWRPLTVIHRPERVTILLHLVAPSASVEEMADRWMQFSDYVALVGQISVPEDPPRVLPVQQYDTFVEPDVPQQPKATTTHDEPDIDVHLPRHAVDGYEAIATKLERLLNLRILTEGTKAYTVAEECLSIARSYIGQPTIGHRSRRRRCMNDH
ncbi:hypothetical protein GmHk_13G036965 [Glycine max]|nr:hypothetical protein GmHk_13G036965 [Glycine max]